MKMSKYAALVSWSVTSNNGLVSIHTTFGFVQGKLKQIPEIPFDLPKQESEVKKFLLSLKDVPEDNQALLMILGSANIIDQNQESAESVWLTDATIISNGVTLNCGDYQLFLDQIVGLMPGTSFFDDNE